MNFITHYPGIDKNKKWTAYSTIKAIKMTKKSFPIVTDYWAKDQVVFLPLNINEYESCLNRPNVHNVHPIIFITQSHKYYQITDLKTW